MRSRPNEAMKKAVAVGGGGKGGTGTAPTDLLVCFPARQHLTLMPKPICSPSRTTMDKAAAARRRQLQLHQLPGASAAAAAGGGGRLRGSSPMFRASKSKQRAEEEEEEPQSPKVTCAGQIKVGRPKKVKPGPGSTPATKRGSKDGVSGRDARSWITVVEEIERLHDRRTKKVGWLESLGIRRDAMPFLGATLRSLRFKARCFGFGSLQATTVNSSVDSNDDDGNDDAGAGERGSEHGARGSAAASVFSKWLMVLEGGGQETLDLEQDDETRHDEEQGEDVDRQQQGEETTDKGTNAPPPNALLLMRCRSAPAKGLSMYRRRTCEQLALAGEVDEDQEKKATDDVPGDGETEDKEELVFMSTAPGFMKLSLDIAKETWVVGRGDPIAVRSRSWR